MKNLLCAIFVIPLLFGCAAGPKRIATTTTGRPEVVVNSLDIDLIKSTAINELAKYSFMLEDDSSYSMFFTRTMTGSQAIFSQLLIGNSHSSTPKAEIRLNTTKQTNTVRLIAYISMSTQMPLGKINRQDMNSNNVWFNETQNYLLKIKKDVEAQQTPSESIQ